MTNLTGRLTTKRTVFIALPIIAVAVILLTYSGAFESPIIIGILLALYVVVSIYNRRKFSRQDAQKNSKS